MIGWLFDGFLAAGLLWLSWQIIVSSNLLRGIILFIAFGLLLALCWTRLAAPDVALAEAAIGAGLTGALLLDTYRSLLARNQQENSASNRSSHTVPPLSPLSGALILLILCLIIGLSWVLLTLPEAMTEAGTLAQARVPESGVSNPITAVLLNFRSHDTLLEVAVLLIALLGTWTVSEEIPSHKESKASLAPASPMMNTLIRLLIPMVVLTGGYLLWAGTHAPGGAFQAGAVLAAIGVLLSLGERLPTVPFKTHLLRGLLSLGLMVFSTVGLGLLIWSGQLLEYPPAWAGSLILTIESALTVSIALTLALLFHRAPA